MSKALWEKVAWGLLTLAAALVAYLCNNTMAAVADLEHAVQANAQRNAVQDQIGIEVYRRLDRIETKVDVLLERSKP